MSRPNTRGLGVLVLAVSAGSLLFASIYAAPVSAGNDDANTPPQPVPGIQGGNRPALRVVATVPILGAIAREIGRERTEVKILTLAQQDPHFVSPRPTLMRTVAEADVLIETGLGLEVWLAKVVSGAGNARVRSGAPGRIIAGSEIRTVEVPRGEQLSRRHGDVHPQGNPHVWLDPHNARQMTKNIAAGLERIDPSGAETYRQNAAAFAGRLDRKLDGWVTLAEPLQGRSFVSYHTTWSYLAARFGFDIPLQVEVRPGIPPSARHRDVILRAVRDRGVPALLTAPYYDRRALDYIAENTGARILVLPVQPDAERAGAGYVEMIDGILSVLVDAVQER